MVLYSLIACLAVLLFMLGACVFSFLNVIVYRAPRKMSFVKGFSICPNCGHRLGALDLVPIFSYLFLRGNCRYCKAHIGIRDTLVELMGGFLAIFCVWRFENYGQALTAFLFYCVLTVVTFLDIDTMEIEDECHIVIVLLAVLAVFIMPEQSILSRVIGAVCISVPMFLVTLLVPGGFGGGDIKLMAACGLFLGWKATLLSAALGILFGGGYGIWLLLTKQADRKAHFAFGPFLCLGMAIGLPYSQQLIDAYISIML